jgi:hypothetical protein
MSTTTSPDDRVQPGVGTPLDEVRRLIVDRAREQRLTMADLSRASQRNESYMHQFIHRGTPKRLPEEVRAVLADILKVPEDALRPHGARLRKSIPSVNPSATIAPQSAAPLLMQCDVPVYPDNGEVDPNKAAEWTWRPPRLMTAGGTFAVWISRPRGRLRAGDLVYVRLSQPPRVGDLVVALDRERIVAIGELVALDTESVTIQDAPGEPQGLDCAKVRLLRVVGVEFL